MYIRNLGMPAIILLLLGSCVSQQKYKALTRARDVIELKATEYSVQLAQERTKALSLQNKNEDLSRQLMQTNVHNQRLNRELDEIKEDESNLAASHQELTAKYEDMRDYFDIVLNECDQDKISVARKQRLLDQQEEKLEVERRELEELSADLLQRAQRMNALEDAADDESVALDAIYQDLTLTLGDLVSERFSISKMQDAIKIAIDEPVLFETGSIDIAKHGLAIVEQLAVAFNSQDNINITVVGHTDKNRIAKKSKYLTDNWDLSVLKAASLTRALTEAKMDPRIVTVAGRGSEDPMVSNLQEEGREKNKRTEIFVTPSPAGQANANRLQRSN